MQPARASKSAVVIRILSSKANIMEHLLLPEGAKPFIHVPYYAPNERDWYDGKGHELYPQRMGWTETEILGQVSVPPGKEGSPFGTDKNGNPRTDTDIQRFFQTWLYFGTVTEFLNAGHPPNLLKATTESFVGQPGPGQTRTVTTTYLPISLSRWCESTVDKEKLWSETTAILIRTLNILNHFCQEPKEQHPSNHNKAVTWPVSDEISTSIIALVFTLIQVAVIKCDKVVEGFPTKILARSKILYRRLEKKWCLADATRFEDELEIDGQYYMAMSPGLPQNELDNHISCTRDRCHYEMDAKRYVTKHAPPPWHHAGCERAIWGGQFGGLQKMGKAKDWVDSVCKIIEADGIPIVLWSVSEKKFFTVEVHKKKGEGKPPYIAISHVWSDGKGNPFENSLPMCQLENIQDMVEKLRFEGRKPAVASPYSDGIGFWMDTLCVPLGDELRVKKLKKKAIGDMRCIYEHASAVLILDEWLRQIPSTAPTPVILIRMYQSGWIKRLWTHQEGFFPKELWVQFSDKALKLDAITARSDQYGQEMIPKGIYLNFPNVTSLRFSLQYGFLKHAYLNIEKNKNNIWKLYKPLIHVMRMRQTTRETDECICIATILGLDLDPYWKINDGSEADIAKGRMALFLTEIKTFSMGIIFNNWERLNIPGFRWAPRSLLAHRGGRDDVEMGSDDKRTSEIQWNGDEAGLPVQYAGFAPFTFSKATRMSVSCADRAFAVQLQLDDDEIQWPLMAVEVYPNHVAWDRTSQYAVILSKIPEGNDEGLLAVIGNASTSPGEVISFMHLCLARVRILKDATADWIDTVTVTPLAEETKWIVM